LIAPHIDWTPLARAHLTSIYEYISEDSPAAADRQIEIVLSAIDRLIDFPEMGRAGRCRNTRELVVSGTPYIVAYRITRSVIQILAIMHGYRRWPRNFSD
jgi:addiction module RelE/StbE family toxin